MHEWIPQDLVSKEGVFLEKEINTLVLVKNSQE